MTTIATDGQTMAGDGLVTSGGIVFGRTAVKVQKLSDGRLVGICGNARYAAPFVAWLESGGDVPEMDDEFEALVVSADGTCKSYDYKGRSLDEELPTASGSGREIALGALVAGSTPEGAVRAACERDTMTGGEITIVSLPAKLKRVA
jgi:ATP-dependent protease HslVU (ClpYQ) peptidase subunit